MRQSRDSLALSSNESSSPTSPPEALTIARKCSKTSKQVEQDTGIWETFNSAAATPRFDSHALSRAAVLCRSTGTQSQKILSELEKWIVNNQHSGSPGADQLLVLVKFNVFRALISNSTTLGFHSENGMSDNALSPFNNPVSCPSLKLTVPSSLRPTDLQCQTPHHPWIDLLPIPRMRDNLLRAGDDYDDIELCGDLVGYFNSPTVRTGMVIWGDPWDVEGWEVTDQFLERWGWTIRGCSNLFASTNRWREKRGERPLRFDRFLCDDQET